MAGLNKQVGDALSAIDFNSVQYAAQGNGVLSGLDVVENTNVDMNVIIQSGSGIANGATFTVSNNQTVAVTTANTTYERIDTVSIASNGTATITDGTPAATPVPANIPANEIPLATISVPANDTTVSNSQITSRKVITQAAWKYVTSNTTYAETSSSSYVLLGSLTVPANTISSDIIIYTHIKTTGRSSSSPGGWARGVYQIKVDETTEIDGGDTVQSNTNETGVLSGCNGSGAFASGSGGIYFSGAHGIITKYTPTTSEKENGFTIDIYGKKFASGQNPGYVYLGFKSAFVFGK